MGRLVNLLYSEVSKLKRSKIFLISLIGATTSPIVCFIAYITYKNKYPNEPVLLSEVFSQTNMYTILLIGVPLYGVITAYLFNREYTENTLKNLLTVPISRIGYLFSKIIILFIWVMVMTLVAWIVTVILGIIGQFEGLSTIVILKAFKEFLIGGFFLFLLLSPTIFVTLLFKNYIPTVVFTLIITMINVLIVQSEYYVLFPWSAIEVIITNSFIPKYPSEYSYISIYGTSIIGFIALPIYFKREDIH